jgi:hypothetical protein
VARDAGAYRQVGAAFDEQLADFGYLRVFIDSFKRRESGSQRAQEAARNLR